MTDAAAAKPKAAPKAHPPFSTMVEAAVTALKDRKGTSRQAIKKYIKANYKVKDNADTFINGALRKMVASEVLVNTKGVGSAYKLAKKPKEVKKPKAKKPKAAAKKAVKKPAKKAAAKKSPKKAAAKKPAKKAAKKVKKSPKKAATKAKKPVAKKTAKKPAKKSTKAKK